MAEQPKDEVDAPEVGGGKEEPRRYGPIAPRPPEGDVDLTAVIAGDGPLELDVGFGRGMSIFTRAERSPESRIIGVEIKVKWAYKVEERRKRLGLGNVQAWAGDIRELLPRSGPERCLDRVYVHFPDPWWKKRHFKKRLVVAPAFLEQMDRLLADDGELYVQTDVEDRGAYYEQQLQEHPAFVVERLEENPFGAISNRERRADEDGLPVYRYLARRK